MTKLERAKVVREMRQNGLSYSAIMTRLGCTRTECYVLARYDERILVKMRCKACGVKWTEMKMPENKVVFDCCAVCATVKWERSLVLEREEARA